MDGVFRGLAELLRGISLSWFEYHTLPDWGPWKIGFLFSKLLIWYSHIISLWSSLEVQHIFKFSYWIFFLEYLFILEICNFFTFFQLWNCFLCFLYVDNFLLSACLLSGSWFYGTKYHGHFLVFIIEVLSLLDPWTVQYYFTDILIYCWLSVARVKFYHVRVVWLPVPRLHPCVLGSLEPASARGTLIYGDGQIGTWHLHLAPPFWRRGIQLPSDFRLLLLFWNALDANHISDFLVLKSSDFWFS